ncbi:MAG: hypothetical protein KIS66_04400 [Fimbriimonadaceae bacterium]|nr:hypothetical protein [Fimbriimonadaceae bacterium]
MSGAFAWIECMGPPTRARNERLFATVLGHRDGPLVCPKVVRVGLRFLDGSDPVKVIESLAKSRSVKNAESARALFAGRIPAGPRLAYPASGVFPRLSAHDSDPDRVLWTAVVLGLCTATYYDPARTVLWTRASLVRHLDLFATEGFYALD